MLMLFDSYEDHVSNEGDEVAVSSIQRKVNESLRGCKIMKSRKP